MRKRPFFLLVAGEDFMKIRRWRLKENIKTARRYIPKDLLIDETRDPS
jgi:hypothetical protein